jgi:hypothetical protein
LDPCESLTIAAPLWMPINPTRGAKLFRIAARLYWELNFEKSNHDVIDLGFEVPLAICGQDTELLRKRSARWLEIPDALEAPETSANKLLAFSHLALALKSEEFFQGLSNAREAAMSRPAHRIGRLGFPLTAYSALAEGVQYTQHAVNLYEDGRSLREFAERLDEEVRSAQANNYHWQNFFSASLPIDPLGLAFCCVWDRVIENDIHFQQRGRIENFFSNLPIRARAYFETAHQIVISTSQELG